MKTATVLRIVVAVLLVAAILTAVTVLPVKDYLARLLQATGPLVPGGRSCWRALSS